MKIHVLLILFLSINLFSQNTEQIPEINGEWKLSSSLTVDLSKINDPDGIKSFEYQWLSNNNNIDGATSSSYKLTLPDLQNSISVSVQYTDNLGNINTLNSLPIGSWGQYQYLTDKIKNAQAAVVRITASTAVMISPTHAITAAHSPLDENNEITPNLTVQNIYGETRNIINVIYDIDADFAIVELESPFENSYSVEIASTDSSAGEAAFAIGNPKDTAAGGVGWAVSFGFARDIVYEEFYKLFDIQIMGGFSGGGIFNNDGNLVGIISGGTSQYSQDSFRPELQNRSDFFREDFEVHDGPWKELNRMQVSAINLSFINEFMTKNNITNEVYSLDKELPKNKIDHYYDSISEDEKSQIHNTSKPYRKSVVAFSVGGSLSEGNFPNGSGILLTDRIIATNSHVVEGKEGENLIITLYNLDEVNGSVLDHHNEMDVSLVLLDSPITNISPVKLANSRPKLGDKGFIIGHPANLWSKTGAWQVASAVSGYKTDQIDDRGDILMEGGASEGMSGGPIFNMNGELTGIAYAGGSSISLVLDDYQDPHSTYYNPIVSPHVSNIIGVDVAGIRDLIDENSIFFDNHISPNSSHEVEYFKNDSDEIFSLEKNSTSTLKLSQIKDYSFNFIKDIELDLNHEYKWSLLGIENDSNGNFYVINSFLKDYSPGLKIIKLDNSLNIKDDFSSNGYHEELLKSTNVQKLIKFKIFDNILYLLTQDNNNKQISHSLYTLNLDSPNEFVQLVKSIENVTHKSNFFPKDFEINSDGIFIAGTTDYAPASIGQGKRTYDHFVSKYNLKGSLENNFATNGIFQIDHGDTEKLSGIKIQDDGKIIIYGINWLEFASDAIATRLNTDGSIDTSFGVDGTTIVEKFLEDREISIDDRGREEANDLFISEEGNIYVVGTKYIGWTSEYTEHNQNSSENQANLSASDGQYESAIWKYDSNGKIIDDFGNHRDYSNGSIPGLKTLNISGDDKIQKIFSVDNEIYVFVHSREDISTNTSSYVFKLNDNDDGTQFFASEDPTFYVPNPLKTIEDNPLRNIKITPITSPGKEIKYSISSPSKATIVDNGNLTFDYIPNSNLNGSDSFIIELEVDGNKISKDITVAITPGNDTPSILGGNKVSTNEDVDLNLTLHDVDGDDQIINYRIDDSIIENGKIINNEDLSLTYRPNENFYGQDEFKVIVDHVYWDRGYQNKTDEFTVVVSVNPVNDAPVVSNVQSSTNEDNALDITLRGSDVEGDDLTYSIVDNPSNGTLSLNEGKVKYTPNDNYNGEDTFTYKVNDGTDDSNTSTVTINVNPVNDAPVVSNVQSSTNEDNALDITLRGSDVEGDDLTYSIVDNPSNGTLSLNEGKVKYTPNDNYNGEDTFTYKVNDGTDDSNTSTVTINVNPVNDAPVVSNVQSSTDEDNALDITLRGSDVEGDDLTYSIVDNPSNGTLSLNEGKVKYTPNDNYNGEDTFTYKVNDGTDDSNTSTVTINVNPVNDAPTVIDLSLSTKLNTNGSTKFDGTDIDEDTLTYIVATEPENGSVSIENDTFIYSPDNNYVGQDTFTYKANDGSVDSNQAIVTVDIEDVDLDSDGVSDRFDQCPDTPEDTTVDVNGCPVFTLPLENNKVSVTSASCIGNTDGSIGLSIEDDSYNYTVTVTGQDDPISLGAETKTASVTGLGTGAYTVCFKVDGQDAYEQCFEVNIAEPKALSAFIDVDNDNRTTSIQLSGSSSYNVEVNGQRFDVKGDRFTTNLPTGLSIIKISTDLDCQGIIEREIFISEDIHYYPNPTQTDVNVHVSGEDTMVQVSVFSEKGDLIYTREQQIQDFSRKTNIDLSRQITGTYIVVMDGPTVRKTFKIVKK